MTAGTSEAIAAPLEIAQGFDTPITPTTPAAKQKMAEGLTLIQQGRIDPAIVRFREAIALDQNLWQAYYNLGLALRQTGDLQGSVQAFYQTVVIEPNFALGYANVGGILVDVQNWSQAELYLQRAIAMQPNLAIAHYNLGLVHRQSGRRDAAMSAWETARRLAPELIESSLQLAEVYLSGDRRKDAKKIVTEILSSNNRIAAAHYLQGRIAAQENKPELALNSFRQASQLDPTYANAYFGAAKVLIDNGRSNAAMPLLDYALLLYTQQNQDTWAQTTRILRQRIQ
ncbi:MAG: tetratricopeptide repeat protein [Limnothrix sp.]